MLGLFVLFQKSIFFFANKNNFFRFMKNTQSLVGEKVSVCTHDVVAVQRNTSSPLPLVYYYHYQWQTSRGKKGLTSKMLRNGSEGGRKKSKSVFATSSLLARPRSLSTARPFKLPHTL